MKRYLQKSGTPFAFTPAALKALLDAKSHYPEGKEKSAVMAALHLVQTQEGWISQEAVDVVGGLLNMPPLKVWEVASFYSMYNLAPMGTYHLQVCTTTPCWLRGSDDVFETCHKKAAQYGKDVFTVSEVECLGGCVNAPLLQINNDFHEDLTKDATADLLDALAQNKPVTPGSCLGRQGSAPLGKTFAPTSGETDHA